MDIQAFTKDLEKAVGKILLLQDKDGSRKSQKVIGEIFLRHFDRRNEVKIVIASQNKLFLDALMRGVSHGQRGLFRNNTIALYLELSRQGVKAFEVRDDMKVKHLIRLTNKEMECGICFEKQETTIHCGECGYPICKGCDARLEATFMPEDGDELMAVRNGLKPSRCPGCRSALV